MIFLEQQITILILQESQLSFCCFQVIFQDIDIIFLSPVIQQF